MSTAAQSPHQHRLAALLGEGTWKWDGEILDNGACSEEHCVCGQRIRYVFRISSDKGHSQLGSTCISELDEVNGELAERMRVWAKFKSAQKAALKKLANLKKFGKEVVSFDLVPVPYGCGVLRAITTRKEVIGLAISDRQVLESLKKSLISGGALSVPASA